MSANNAFYYFASMLTASSILLFSIITIFSIVDVSTYIYREAQLAKNMVKTADQVLLKDTTDFQHVITYSTYDPKNESYNVYKQQGLVSSIFALVAIAIVGVFTVFCYYGFMITFKSEEAPSSLPISQDSINVFKSLIIVTVGAVVLSAYYKSSFTTDVQTKIKSVREQLSDIRRYVISGLPLSIDTSFWDDLKGGDNDAIIQRLAILISNAKSTTDKNAETARKIIFTCNLYSYFSNIIAENDNAYKGLSNLFSPNGNKRDVDVNQFFYYPDPLPVEAVAYHEFAPRLIAALGDKLQSSVVKDILASLNSDKLTIGLQQEVSSLKSLPFVKSTLRNFLIATLLVCLVFTVVLVLFNFASIADVVISVWEKIKRLLRRSQNAP